MGIFSQERAEASEQNALELLKDDHTSVSSLFERYEDEKQALSSVEKGGLAKEICDKLSIHAQIEEELFYPACKAALEDADDLLAEAKVEHQSLKMLIAQIEQEEPETDEFDAKVKVLGEYVKHHVKEEEGELFPKARRAELDLEALGADMAARKTELLAGESAKEEATAK